MPKQATVEGILQNEAVTTIEAPKVAAAKTKDFQVQAVTLASGEQRTIFFDRTPDDFYIMLPARTVGLVAWVWPGTSLPPERLPVYGDGHTMIPARGQAVTIEATDAVELRIIGLSNLKLEIEGSVA